MIYDHGGNADKPPMFRVTVHFSENAGKTKMEMSMALPTPEAAANTKKFIKKAGGDTTWDRLAEYLSCVDAFVINRSFDVPIDRMFELWTDPKHFSRWLPPAGFTMKYLKADIRPGGSTFYCMSNDSGMKMHGKASFTCHPMAPTWPETMLTTVTLKEEGPDKTRVTIQWEVFGVATPAERETFHKTKAGMTQGWTGSFDKLEEYLRQ